MELAPAILGYQSWRHLLFIHWRMAAADLQPLLPDGLEIETFDGSAWLAVVPFSMERVRPWWSPPVPGISWFLETNVRTYVRHRSGQNGVWFISLDANHRLAVAIARRIWHLNYVFAKLQMRIEHSGKAAYSGMRHRQSGNYAVEVHVDRSVESSTAEPGTLDEFLLERYHLITRRPDGTFMVGQVHHGPYRFFPVAVAGVVQTLTTAQGCSVELNREPDHIVYSPGVDVGISALRACSGKCYS